MGAPKMPRGGGGMMGKGMGMGGAGAGGAAKSTAPAAVRGLSHQRL